MWRRCEADLLVGSGGYAEEVVLHTTQPRLYQHFNPLSQTAKQDAPDIINVVTPNQRAQNVVIAVARGSAARRRGPGVVAVLDLREAAAGFVERRVY